MTLTPLRTRLAAALCLLPLVASGQSAPTPAAPAAGIDSMTQAAQQALLGNPEVGARFNAFVAADEAVGVARAGRGPSLDLQGALGVTRDDIRNRSPRVDTLSYTGAALNLRQVLWDGLGTERDIGRLGHEKLARWFEFVDASEQMALEVARTWYDVLRYRELVRLAEENYVQHRYALLQIDSRVRAGVSRGVDLEQAAARVALAESNLVTETSNLHDVSARYQRLVGSPPPATMPLPTGLDTGLPATAEALADAAVRQSAAVTASIETLRAAREAARQRESLLQPRVEASVRSGIGHNFDAVSDQRRDTTAQVTLNWNLYDGGADRARVRQQVQLLNQATDLRDKTCRDTRQTGLIAYHDTRKLAEQIVYLERNVLAIQKARDAYRQQFDIGQRSLLDVLNAENELYTAQRALANARYDLGTAYARAQAAAQQLGTRLGLRPMDAGDRAAEAGGWQADGDAPTRCPAQAVAAATTDKRDLDARARQLAETARPLPAAPASPAPSAAPSTTPPRAPAAAPARPSRP